MGEVSVEGYKIKPKQPSFFIFCAEINLFWQNLF
jgi:hypothetical protein